MFKFVIMNVNIDRNTMDRINNVDRIFACSIL